MLSLTHNFWINQQLDTETVERSVLRRLWRENFTQFIRCDSFYFHFVCAHKTIRTAIYLLNCMKRNCNKIVLPVETGNRLQDTIKTDWSKVRKEKRTLFHWVELLTLAIRIVRPLVILFNFCRSKWKSVLSFAFNFSCAWYKTTIKQLQRNTREIE